MVDSYCKCCGQVLPLVLPAPLAALAQKLPGKRRKMFERIYSAGPGGIHSDRLIHLIYGEDPDGGPDWAQKCINVMAYKINSVLRPRGWRVTAKRKYAQGTYFLEKIVATPETAVSIIREVCQ